MSSPESPSHTHPYSYHVAFFLGVPSPLGPWDCGRRGGGADSFPGAILSPASGVRGKVRGVVSAGGGLGNVRPDPPAPAAPPVPRGSGSEWRGGTENAELELERRGPADMGRERRGGAVGLGPEPGPLEAVMVLLLTELFMLIW
jgi:hypothetical protein